MDIIEYVMDAIEDCTEEIVQGLHCAFNGQSDLVLYENGTIDTHFHRGNATYNGIVLLTVDYKKWGVEHTCPECDKNLRKQIECEMDMAIDGFPFDELEEIRKTLQENSEWVEEVFEDEPLRIDIMIGGELIYHNVFFEGINC